MKILGLTGRMGAGKDYLYTQLAKVFLGRVFRMAFADGVKLDIEETLLDEIVQVQTYDGDELEYRWRKPYKPEIRRLLQWWGTEFRRGQDPDYWIKHAANRLAREVAFEAEVKDLFGLRPEPVAVFTDVRFPNEADWIRSQGGKVVFVFATPTVRAERLGISLAEVDALTMHASEASVGSIKTDLVVDNTGGDAAALRLERFVTEWLTEG